MPRIDAARRVDGRLIARARSRPRRRRRRRHVGVVSRAATATRSPSSIGSRAPALETSFANGGQISASYAEPWANPGAPLKILKWLGAATTRRCCSVRGSTGGNGAGALQFLIECLPSRTRHNTIQCLNLALYSRDCLQALRGETGIEYDQLERGILQFYTEPRRVRARRRGGGPDARIRLRSRRQDARRMRGDRAGARAVSRPPRRRHLHGDRRIRRCAALHGGAGAHGGRARRDVRAGTPKSRRWCRAATRSTACASCATGASNRSHADAYVMALGSYSPFLLAPIGVPCNIYPAKGYSATIDIGEHRGAPTVSLTDFAWKIVLTRLGQRLRVAGTAELTGWDTHAQPDALRGAHGAHVRAVPRRRRPRERSLLDGTAARDAVERAADRQDALSQPVPQHRATARSAGRWRADRRAGSPTSSPAASPTSISRFTGVAAARRDAVLRRDAVVTAAATAVARRRRIPGGGMTGSVGIGRSSHTQPGERDPRGSMRSCPT